MTTPIIHKLLIANRGEIACRVIRTAKAMGILTVAVYSEADKAARHVRLADEAIFIGPSAAKESYLCIDKILAAAKQTGATTIHPGYGFLSENEQFALACKEAGILFVGPTPEAIAAMGSKSAAKRLMEAASVPLTPSYHGEEQSPDFLHQAADQIGYPVLIKASAGGGGKGMRRVDESSQFLDALASCQREAKNSFGDDQVLIEKYISPARHIEIQVFGDQHGNVVYLQERDCSVQRRHQKVLEEAPAPGMTSERRKAMGEAAVAAAKAVNYQGAGTVEFIVGPSGDFYFMEMNTRLQVEHPVTEMITGLDLVEWQLKVVAGLPLPLSQAEIPLNGHAIEARIYAEDPSAGFLPSIGHLHWVSLPAASDTIRVDTGVETGDEISPFYDPMIAKLIVWGEDRTTALTRLKEAIANYRVVGVKHNLPFLYALASSDDFSTANLSTSLIEANQASLLPTQIALSEAVICQLAIAHFYYQRQQTTNSPWQMGDDWRNSGEFSQTITLCFSQPTQQTVSVSLKKEADGVVALFGGTSILASVKWQDQRGEIQLSASYRYPVYRFGSSYHYWQGANQYVMTPEDPMAIAQTVEAAGGLHAPMPGKIIAHLAKPGSTVKKGQPLLILEAMKMEHTITSPNDGVLEAYCYDVGEQITADVLLVQLLAEGEKNG
ncbi:acetyl/propionyl/methylcrotonyl-CoA carboxylase subunit alpha [Leeia sp. TBRC 13508]|uniref:Acetyl/propionyl/methylcrotonyl-CoA carboxylase subunit alpha n=1 Tax=Leeia speluncae TaxID=2884804 RepID=A0ABS8D8W2_9NEIS|nr:acetyl/propionyl/methylcrotonyl-CoA carboxylase subunit alpha [Leeia speluncae]MCB6184664.1 acetyl/propionyl/methylcrotonyl-CoA carboxylase subunit alpha [Leeia speluncae]